jgi:hypothetical protein
MGGEDGMSAVQRFTAVATGDDTGYTIRVLPNGPGEDLVKFHVEWDEFRFASAGHRLIEHGYMIAPEARTSETRNGWQDNETPDTYSVLVVSTQAMGY